MANGISYQNKDIEFKILSEGYKEKSFHALGLELPKIKELLPTNLPRVSADEKRIDNLFLLVDDTVAIVDYEAEDKRSNRVKYMNYIARVLERYEKDKKKIKDLRIIIIYTGDVQKAESVMEMSCFTLRMEQVFLSKLDGETIFDSIRVKIERKEKLTEEELMQLIILPLTDKGKEKKQNRIKQIVELAKEIEEEEQQLFVLTGILVNTNQFIDRDYAKQIRRWLNLNKVFQLFEEEKQDAVNEARQKEKQEVAKSLLEMDLDIIKIMKATGLTRKEIEEIKEKMTIAN